MQPPTRSMARAASGLVLVAVLLGACGSTAGSADPPRASRPPTASPSPSAPATPEPAVLSVPVRPFREPLDYAHRNYCGAGATEVLLSAWTAAPPDVETVARAIGVDPRSGTTGAATVAGINALLAAVVRPVLGADRYRGAHVTVLSDLVGMIRHDLGDPAAVTAFGHGVPVMVQAMTKTLPGWAGWQATHMITIAAADLRSGDPAVDTVTYAETPSPIAGYNGPPFQTITVAHLWAAMEAFLRDDPRDTVNVIW